MSPPLYSDPLPGPSTLLSVTHGPKVKEALAEAQGREGGKQLGKLDPGIELETPEPLSCLRRFFL